MEISLPNPSSALSNQQQPVGVIVKYDTSHKLNPIQLTHSNVEKVWDWATGYLFSAFIKHYGIFCNK